MNTTAAIIISLAVAFAGSVGRSAVAQDTPLAAIQAPALTAEAVNAAHLEPTLLAPAPASSPEPHTAIVRLQILLDRAAASPGVIDGFDGDNVRKAVLAFERLHGLPENGDLDPDLVALLDPGGPVMGQHTITDEDAAAIVPPLPSDYAELAKLEFLGFTSIEEMIAERFHMDVDLLRALNPTIGFAVGDTVSVADFGPDRTGTVARIEADKGLRQVRAYDAEGTLLAAYPATIGSDAAPSPSGTHTVKGVAHLPTYTYNPEVNFQQADNTEVLQLPPGPNGPVGSVWIDLSEPTYGIHGSPEPSLIDKTASHGCVRLTNWDAEELAAMVEPGVTVEFLG